MNTLTKCGMQFHCRFIGLVAVITTLLGSNASAAVSVSILHEFGPSPASTGLGPRSGLIADESGTLYGTLAERDAQVWSSVFAIQPNGSGFRLVKAVTSPSEGYAPDGALVLRDGVLFGVMAEGGDGFGTVFRVNTDGTEFEVLKRFAGADGAKPRGLISVGTSLFGATWEGGTAGAGTIFRIDPDGNNFAVIHHLSPAAGGRNPSAVLLAVEDTLFGTTWGGGSANTGTIFRLNTDGSGFTTIHQFNSFGGSYPLGGLIHESGVLYGTTSRGYPNQGGVFRIGVDGSDYREIKSYATEIGLDSFPQTGLLLAGDWLYGTTSRGGAYFAGSVFRVRTDGSAYERISSLVHNIGWDPAGKLLLLGDSLYATAIHGGTADRGALFRTSINGGPGEKFRDFSRGDGAGGTSTTIFGNMIYGVTREGGAGGWGTVYRMRTDGSGYTTVMSLGRDTGWGLGVPDIQADNGFLYVTTRGGGPGELGTLFRVRVDGADFKILRNFGSDKGNPSGIVVVDGVIYGTTDHSVYRVNADGSDFSELRLLEPGQGRARCRPVVSGNVVYVATESGLFRVNTDGTGYAVLNNFGTQPPNPIEASQSLVLVGNILFGASYAGGEVGLGTIYRIGTDGSGYQLLKSFRAGDYGRPGRLIYYRGQLFGLAQGTNIFSIGTNGAGYSVIHQVSAETVAVAGFSAGRLYASSDVSWITTVGSRSGHVFALGPFSEPPIAYDATYYRIGTSLVIPVAALISNFTFDPDGDLPTLVGVGPSAQGAKISWTTDQIHYTATSDASDEFEYSISDGLPEWATARVRVELIPPGGKILSLDSAAAGITLHSVAQPGSTYQIQSSTNLVNWTLRHIVTVPASGLFEYLDHSPTSPSFYRLQRN